MGKRYLYLAIALALITASLGAQISILNLSGSAPPVLYDPNWGSMYIISGTLTVTRTTTVAGDPFTIDLTPASTARNEWF